MSRFPGARPFSAFGVAATVAVGVLAVARAAEAQPSYSVLHNFAGSPMDGSYPAHLIQGLDGTLYGTTLSGGSGDLGTVFQMTRDGSAFMLLHSFTGTMDGANPADLIQGPDGTLYGTTEWGGPGNRGAVFQMNPDGTGYALLHGFAGGTDGAQPEGGLIQGPDGTLYGVTVYGGSGDLGTVFQINQDGSGYTVLHRFTGTPMDGTWPLGLIQGPDGTLYGTTVNGGAADHGTVFQMAPDGSGFTLLHSFTGAPMEGAWPLGLIQSPDGTLYGTTRLGGAGDDGTVFQMNADGSGFTLLHSFAGGPTDGAEPLRGSLIQSPDGALYGTTRFGGSDNDGTVFQTAADGSGFTLLHSFNGATDGTNPTELIRGPDGTLYGTTSGGGPGTFGVVFSLAQDCNQSIRFDPPITILNGGTYTGNWESPDADVPAVGVYTTDPVTIVNAHIRGSGDLVLTRSGVNLAILQSCFSGTNPNIAGRARGSAVHAFNPTALVVEHNQFESVGYYGVWMQQYLGDHTAANSARIRFNRFHNVDARFSDGSGGYLPDSAQVSHAVILSNALGVPAVEIAWNQFIQEPYRSAVGDTINIFESSGTSASPMDIHDNYIQGGWDTDPANGEALQYFGSAFTTDGFYQTDPALVTAFLRVHDNQAVGFGNSGIGVAIGHDVELYRNRVISAGQLADGTSSATQYALGIQHWDWQHTPPGVFGNNSVHDNVAGVRKRDRDGTWQRLDYSFPIPPAYAANNVSFTPVDASSPTLNDEAAEYARWTDKLATQMVTVGPSGHPQLGPGQAIRSDNGRFRLAYQLDGNLVLSDDVQHTTTWATDTAGTRPGFATMQADGNFVLHDADGVARWASATAGNPNAFLLLGDDGRVVIYRADGQLLWSRPQ